MKKYRNGIWIGAVVIILILLAILLINAWNKKGGLIELTYQQVMDKMEKNEHFALVISRTTCSHCADYKPKVKSVGEQYGIDLYYIDIDKYTKEEQDAFEKLINFGGSTPTTVFLKDGKETTSSNRLNGDVSTDKIIAKLKSNELIK